jgi:hypothetical protein
VEFGEEHGKKVFSLKFSVSREEIEPRMDAEGKSYWLFVMGYWGRGRRTSNIEHPTLNIELEEEEELDVMGYWGRGCGFFRDLRSTIYDLRSLILSFSFAFLCVHSRFKNSE